MAAQDLRAALMARVETVAVYYCGEPNRAMSSRSQLRFGRHGSLAVEIAGDRTGIWCDHEAGQGGDLLDLIQRELGCCSFSETLAEAERFVGGCSAPIPPRAAPRAQGGDKQRKIDLAIKVYNESRPIQGTLGEAYLERRGLFVPDGMDALRFHPHCPRGQDRVPAMIAAMRSVATGEITAIHRTFIGPDGAKARLHEGDTAKTMLGQAGGDHAGRLRRGHHWPDRQRRDRERLGGPLRRLGARLGARQCWRAGAPPSARRRRGVDHPG
jgi:hypothetical protein